MSKGGTFFLFLTIGAFLVLTLAAQSFRPKPVFATQAHTGVARASRSCLVSGSIIDDVTGRPIKGAWLLIEPFGERLGHRARAVQTDASGRFKIDDLPPGSYVDRTAADGYLLQSQFVDSLGLQGSLDCVNGAPERNILFRLVPTGGIEGRVTDSDGDRLPGISVDAYRVHYTQFGRTALTVSQISHTDDQGVYRFSGLPIGHYYLVVGPSDSLTLTARKIVLSERGSQSAYPSVAFYPGTADPGHAEAIDLKPGQKFIGNITIRPARVFHVTGKVANFDLGGKYARGLVSLVASPGPMGKWWFASAELDRPTGEFEINGVESGSYVLRAELQNKFGGHVGWGQVPVEVRQSDVHGVRVVVHTSVDLKGKITEDEHLPLGVRVMLLPMDSRNPERIEQPKVDDSLDFSTLQPGSYGLSFQWPGVHFYLKSATFGDEDLLKVPLRVAGPTSAQLHLELGLHPAELDGTVVGADGKAAPGAVVVLVPDPPAPNRFWLYQWRLSGRKGYFKPMDVPPGHYMLFAWRWQKLDSFEWFNPQYLEAAKDFGVAVDLGEGDRKTITLKLVPSSQTAR